VSFAGNEGGSHCGACHDGTTAFPSCRGWPRADDERGCTRCHTGPSHRAPGYDELARRLPLDTADFIDWAAALRRGLVKPVDFVEGVSPRRSRMNIDRDVTINASGTWLRDVTFSHKRHASWNGCELCHPDIFPVTQRGSARYDMAAIRAGQYCGVCHGPVAFPLFACARCHAEEGRKPMR
jgi:c(7)-type cytochrome triheme protein